MNIKTVNRTIHPETHKSNNAYRVKIGKKNYYDQLIVNISHDKLGFIKTYIFEGNQIAEYESIHFKDMFIIKMQESSITQIGSIGNHNKGAISFGTVSECVEKVKGLESALEIQKTVIDMLKSEVDFLRKMLVDKEK